MIFKNINFLGMIMVFVEIFIFDACEKNLGGGLVGACGGGKSVTRFASIFSFLPFSHNKKIQTRDGCYNISCQ
jgi:hypothetical protein